jgi:hypothetical protein
MRQKIALASHCCFRTRVRHSWLRDLRRQHVHGHDPVPDHDVWNRFDAGGALPTPGGPRTISASQPQGVDPVLETKPCSWPGIAGVSG